METGPRGGKFVITRSGEKRYIGGGERVPGEGHELVRMRDLKAENARAKAENARANDPTTYGLEADFPVDKMPNVRTFPEHVEIAKGVLAAHEADYAKGLTEIKGVALPGATVDGRVKPLSSALEKCARKPGEYPTVDKQTDSTGMRITVKGGIDNAKAQVDAVRAHYGGRIIEEENYLDHSKDGQGYRSFHMLVKGETGLTKEVQIRTQNQHTWAEWCHDIYKPHKEGQKEAMSNDNHRQTLNSYKTAMSDHFYLKDSGRPAGDKPPCPEISKQHFGCM